MRRAIHNPFYWLLLLASGVLLVTMLIYMLGWYYVPHPNLPAPRKPMPPLFRWIDQRALWLIAIEVPVIIVLAVLTISLDRFFDPPTAPGDGRLVADDRTEPNSSNNGSSPPTLSPSVSGHGPAD